VREALRSVAWLAALSDGALEDVVQAGTPVTFAPGRALVGELEAGDDLFVLAAGTAKATVAAGLGAPLEVGLLGPGATCGEIALLTRELRSATVTAVSEVQALRIERADFEALLRRHPQIAVHFAREIAARLGDTDRALDGLLAHGHGPDAPEVRRLSGQMAAVAPVRGSFARAWRELVAARARELPFRALVAFVSTLVAIRLAVGAAVLAGAPLFVLLRAAYTTGFLLVIASTATALLRFRPSVRRWLAVTLGVGLALIVNELSVFLAFDVFYIDMTTRDPDLLFNVEALYRRSESSWAVALAVALLVQATYLRRFYRRSAFILATRIRRLAGR
jgi:CRP-like cAMP-binding protein